MASPRAWPTLRRWLRRERSPWALSGFLVLLSIAVAMLVIAGFVAGYMSDLLLNLGAGFVTLAFGSVFFEPVVEQARRGQVIDRPFFDHRQFCARLAEAKHSVSFLGTWTGLLEAEHRTEFLDQLARALDRGVDVRVLLLHPDSAAAAQRAEDLQNVDRPDARDLIRENLSVLDAFARRRAPGVRAPEVRIYDASVSESLYRLDERAIVGKLPLDRLGSDSRQFEAGVTHPLMTNLVARFSELWGHHTTIGLEEYMEVVAYIHVYGADGRRPHAEHRARLRYVLDSHRSWHVIAHRADEYLPDPGAGTMTVTLTRPGGGQTTCPLVPVSGHCRDVRSAFAAKYGPDIAVGRIHRLLPDDETGMHPPPQGPDSMTPNP